jgi:hypothetical protein
MTQALKMSSYKLLKAQQWDKLVQNTYGKPYRLYAQVPYSKAYHWQWFYPGSIKPDESYLSTDIIDEYDNWWGVQFDAWVAKPNTGQGDNYWHSKCYPTLAAVAHDLLQKGLISEQGHFIYLEDEVRLHKFDTLHEIYPEDWTSFITAVYGHKYDVKQQIRKGYSGISFRPPFDDYISGLIDETVPFIQWKADGEGLPDFKELLTDLYQQGLLADGEYSLGS